jgi:hypothetical protein
MQRYNAGERRHLSTIPVSIMMYSFAVSTIDVHDKSRENVVVVVGLGNYKNISAKSSTVMGQIPILVLFRCWYWPILLDNLQ